MLTSAGGGRVPFPHPLSRALSDNPPTVDGLAARGEVLFRCADALQETEGLLSRVAGEVVELGLVVGAAQDQGPLRRRDGEWHVVGDPARLGVDGRDDLTLCQIQRPGTDYKRPVLLPGSVEDAAKGVSGHGSRHAPQAG